MIGDKKKFQLKRLVFAREYLVDLNAKEASIRAGYSEKYANRKGHTLMQNPEVKAEIARLMAIRSAKTEITSEWVLRELKTVAEQSDVTVGTKVKALELIAKHLGMFVEKHEVSLSMSPADRAQRINALLQKGGLK